MEKYCDGCLHKGTNICELPTRAERFGRALLLVVVPVVEGFSGADFVDTGAIPLNGEPQTARSDFGPDVIESRVAACVALHREMDAAEAEGAF